MKSLFLVTALLIQLGLLAQGPNININPSQGKDKNDFIKTNNDGTVAQQQVVVPESKFGSNNTGHTPCSDCEKIKKAIKLSQGSSGSVSHKKKFVLRKSLKKFSGRMYFKLKQSFSRRYKAKPNHAICFNWH